MHHLSTFFTGIKSSIIAWPLWRYWVPSNLLSTAPAPTWPWMWEYVGLLGVLLIGIVLTSVIKRIPEQLSSQLASLCWNNLLVGLVLFFFRYQHVPILGMDLWRLIQECVIVTWLVVVLVQFQKTYPKQRLAQKVEAYKKRFLPKGQ